MRTALITDIHGNREALEAVLDDIEEVGVDRIVCLGDVVGYGADPEAVVERVARLVEDGAVCIRGNHDAAVETGGRRMSENAATAMAWTIGRLSPAHRAFLRDLPLAHEEGDVLYVHASAARPEAWPYVTSADEAAESLDATDARLTFCGHTHVPALFSILHGIAGTTGKTITFRPHADKPVPLSRIRRHLAVIGAVGQPRDGDPRACWGLHDGAGDEVTWHRVPYEVDSALRKIKDAGLPEWLALRLREGR
ncbi:metallophosphoesterase family protein [Oharaeibacter diazotrophicus]|uniref:Calcineurin-like phosphoesterase family protein n=1 Tax=Oharaeibacter diazotrophicus TaxID=1920512 RepID=A0A4R6RJ54_9HYPH|nr:metallophosphoesterase family protein [Oharaeibacter diazotrophicus]TDP86480.1 calcineurin-like phosphoesterase family protein [Oharaeibacter diazotrophicus]BBE71578.1 diadenosine tetraphosphatase [Pleomorphomonas sp. SM30]GLS78339.1 metallophosphoesterase [Oharaeibacter diazotrophicus]